MLGGATPVSVELYSGNVDDDHEGETLTGNGVKALNYNADLINGFNFVYFVLRIEL